MSTTVSLVYNTWMIVHVSPPDETVFLTQAAPSTLRQFSVLGAVIAMIENLTLAISRRPKQRLKTR